MDSTLKVVTVALLLVLCLSASSFGRARMVKLEEAAGSNCWESLVELQSCSAEVVLFFLNGETYLGPGCCEAIRIIHHDCWPTMLDSLGYTNQEADLLSGYCDANSALPPPP